MQTTTATISIPCSELVAMGLAKARAYLSTKSYEQRAELDALLSYLRYDNVSVKYVKTLSIVLHDSTALMVQAGQGVDEALACTVIAERLAELNATVVLTTSLSYEQLA